MAATVIGAALAKTASNLAVSGKEFSKGSCESSNRAAKMVRPVKSVGHRSRTNWTSAKATSARTVAISHVMDGAENDPRRPSWPARKPAVSSCRTANHGGGSGP